MSLYCCPETSLKNLKNNLKVVRPIKIRAGRNLAGLNKFSFLRYFDWLRNLKSMNIFNESSIESSTSIKLLEVNFPSSRLEPSIIILN